jgi:LmbE family N-acetylglucosaminyl deacetylase
MENSTKTILVVSAHAADFVWRAGGAIALYASRGYKVRILCLSYGERGESQGADEWAFASPPRRGSLSATQGDRRSSFPGVRCVYN